MSKNTKKSLAINQISPTTNAALSLLMVLIALVFIVPLVLVISVAFSSREAIQLYGYRFIPREFSLEAFVYIRKVAKGVFRYYLNTIFYSVVGTAASLLIMSMAAYVLSRKDFKARNAFAFYLFFTTLFGGGLVPSYILITRYLNIDNTVWVFLLPGLVGAFNVIILRTFITSTIDDAMQESARLDGASDFQIYAKIVMPLFKPGLASVGLFVFVGKWNDWFTGLTYVRNVKIQPIMTYLTKLQRSMDALKNLKPEEMTPEMMELSASMPGESARMALTIIAILPLLICYPFFQKYFIKGLTVGSVKG